MSLQDEIRACTRCSLCKNMQTSPVPPEWQGNPKIMFVVDSTISRGHDLCQTPLIGVGRTRFIQLIEKYFEDWYITSLVKCSTKSSVYTKTSINECKKWLDEEKKRLKPEVVVGCGERVRTNALCDYYTSSPTRIVQGAKGEKAFEALLLEIHGKINGN